MYFHCTSTQDTAVVLGNLTLVAAEVSAMDMALALATSLLSVLALDLKKRLLLRSTSSSVTSGTTHSDVGSDGGGGPHRNDCDGSELNSGRPPNAASNG
jgi:hypothetical protein